MTGPANQRSSPVTPWSWRVGTFWGIDVKVHVTFVLILAWVAFQHWQRDGTVLATAHGVAFLLLLFGCIVLHEFGHALTARRYGIATRDIILLPIGGIARLENMPRNPRQELWVALAGPAVNLVIAASLFVILSLTGGLRPWGQLGLTEGPLLQRLIPVNLFIMVFNLLPAFPMDGGRILRAILAMSMDYRRATHVAATIGRLLAIGLGLLGALENPFLIFIALFVWMGAGQETSLVTVRHQLARISLRRVLITDFQTLAPLDRLSDAIRLTVSRAQRDLPVVDDGALVGLLTHEALVRALADGGDTQTVQRVMTQGPAVARFDEPTEVVFERLRAQRARTLPVLDENNKLMGLVTLDNMARLLEIEASSDQLA